MTQKITLIDKLVQRLEQLVALLREIRAKVAK